MIGQDFHHWHRQQDEIEHKRREAWMLGFFWGATASLALYAFALATGKTLGLM